MAAATPSRIRRWLRVLLRCAALAVLVVAGLGAWTLAHLETPWLRSRVRAACQQQLGLRVDYGRARVGPGGLLLENLVLDSMPVDRDLAPHLLLVRRVEVAWSLAELAHGRPRVTLAAVDGVSLDVVVDREGETSLQRVLDALPKTPEEPPKPLSRLVQRLRDAPSLTVDAWRVTQVSARVARRLEGQTVQRYSLGDVALEGSLRLGTPHPDVDVRMSGRGLALRAQRQGEAMLLDLLAQALVAPLPWLMPLLGGNAELPLSLSASVALREANRFTMQVRVLRLETAGAGAPLLALEAWVDALPKQQAIRIHVKHLGVDGDLLAAEMDALVPDAGQTTSLAEVTHLAIDGRLGGLWLPLAPGRVDVSAPTLHLGAQGVHLRRDLLQSSVDALDLTTTWAKAGLSAGMQTVQIGPAQLQVHLAAATAEVQLLRVLATCGAADVVAAPLSATVTDAAVDLQADVTPGQIDVRGSLRIATLAGRLPLDAGEAGLQGLEARVDLRSTGWAEALHSGMAALRSLSLNVELDRATWLSVGQQSVLTRPHAAVRLDGLRQRPEQVLESTGALVLEAGFEGAQGPTGVALSKGEASATVTNLRVDLAHPAASVAHLHAKVGLGPLKASAELSKDADAASWVLDWAIDDFLSLVSMLPVPAKARDAVAWSKLSASGHSEGHAQDISQGSAAQLTQQTLVDLRGLTVRGVGAAVELPQTHLDLSSRGRGLAQHVDVSLTLQSPQLSTYRGKGPHVATLAADVDLAAPSVKAALQLHGPASLQAALDLDLHTAATALVWRAGAQVGGLATVLRPLSEEQRLALCLGDPALTASVTAQGSLDGAAGLLRGAMPTSFDGHARLGLDLRHLRCRQGTNLAEVQQLQLDADATQHGKLLHAQGDLRSSDILARTDTQRVRIQGWNQHFAVRRDASATWRAETRASIATLTQDIVPGFGVRDFTCAASGWYGPQGGRIDSLRLDNPMSGTHLTLQGGLDRGSLHAAPVSDADLEGSGAVREAREDGATDEGDAVPGRQGLSIGGELRQDVAALATATQPAKGKGTVIVPFRVESGDLVVYRTTARVRFEHVDLELPQWGVRLEGLDGSVPIAEDFTLAPVFHLLADGEDNAYARWRFSEHQPFLRRDDYVSINRLQYRDAVLGPFAGNMSLDRNAFRMDQLEVTMLGGKLTGQCIVQLDGERTRVLLRGNGTGIRVGGSDQVLDANAALTFLPGQRALDGRAEILQMGAEHVLAMLDLWDPYHEDVQANRTRTYLKLGHPERVRLRFGHGFMDVAITLGGLGSVVRIDEIRGIALGPVFQRWLDPLLQPLQPPPPPEAAP